MQPQQYHHQNTLLQNYFSSGGGQSRKTNAYFNNTNVLTGISSNLSSAVVATHRYRRDSEKPHQAPISQNTNRTQMNIQSVLNSTAPIKFGSNSRGTTPNQMPSHGKPDEESTTICKKHGRGQPTSESHDSKRREYTTQQLASKSGGRSSGEPKHLQPSSQQNSNNNLRNKYNRQPNVLNTSSQSNSKTTSKNLNKTQVITTTYSQTRKELAAHPPKDRHAQPMPSSSSSRNSKPAQNKTGENREAQPTTTYDSAKYTLNEYKQFMEKQKQMLKQLSQNKLALMFNAMNNPDEKEQTTQRKDSRTPSFVTSPRDKTNQPSKKEPKTNYRDDVMKENIQVDPVPRVVVEHTEKQKTPRVMEKQAQRDPEAVTPNHFQDILNKLKNNATTPRQQVVTQQPHPTQPTNELKTPDECTKQDQKTPAPVEAVPPNNQTPAQTNHDDSMVFSNKSSLDEYVIGKQIGQGAYAVVRVGLHKPSNKKVAMKIYKKYKLVDPNRRKSVKREIKLMEKMKHNSIVKLYEVIDTEKYVILVMEYVGGGSLHGYLKSKPNRRLEEKEARRLFRQTIEALRYCHSRHITHRDIKLENLLLDDQLNIKIIDFGFSTCIPNDKKIKIFCGTPSYMAPEIVQKTEYCGPPADIWALGVLLFTILSGTFPYRGATDKELYRKISRSEYKLPPEVEASLSMEAKDLIKRLFTIDANRRPSAKDVLNDPWLSDEYMSQERTARSHSQQPNHYPYRKQNTDSELNQNHERLDHSSQPGQHNYHRANTFNDQPYRENGHHAEPSPQPSSRPSFYAGGQQTPTASQGQTINNNFNTQNVGRSTIVGDSLVLSMHRDVNFNIINNIMQINCDNQTPKARDTSAPPAKEMFNRTAPFQQPMRSEQLDESILQTIANKLGYTKEDTRQYVLQETTFVNILYKQMIENQSSGSLCGKNGVQPSYVPSIASSLNQSNMSASQSNLHGYYGSSYQSQGNSVVNAIMHKGGTRPSNTDNYDSERGFNKLNQTQQNLMLSSSDNDLCSNLSNMSGTSMLNQTQQIFKRPSDHGTPVAADPPRQQREGLIGKQLWRRECM